MSAHNFIDPRGYNVQYNPDYDQICNPPGTVGNDVPLCFPLVTMFLDTYTQTQHSGEWIKWWAQHNDTDPDPQVGAILDEGLGAVGQAFEDLTAEVNAVVANVASISDTIGTLITALTTTITSVINAASKSVTDAVTTLATSIQTTINVVSYQLTNAINAIQAAIQTTINGIGTSIQTTVTAIGADVTSAINSINLDVGSAVGAIGDLFSQTVTRIGQDITDTVKTLTTDLVNAVNGIGAQISSAISATLDAFLPQTLAAISTAEEQIHQLLLTLQSSIKPPGDVAAATFAEISQRYDVLKQRIAETFKVALPPGLKDAIDLLESDVPPEIQAVFNHISDQHAFPDWVQALLNAVTTTEHAGGLFTKLIGFGAILDVVMETVGTPLLRDSGYGFELALKTKQPSFADAIKAYQRQLIPLDRFEFLGGIEGYSIDNVQLLANLATERLAPLEYVNLFRRGLIDQPTLRNNLAAVGIVGEQSTMLMSATEYVPTVTDVLVWLTRDVFIPEFRQRFQMDAEFPELSLPLFRALGISDVNARNFWAAHWDLPSIEEGYRMYRRLSSDTTVASGEAVTLPNGQSLRRVIGADDLRRLLRAKGVEPFWRDKQIAVSFNPFTRVDLRRMLQAGVLSESDVFAGYVNLGYAEPEARQLTQFARTLTSQAAQADIAPWKAGLKAKVITSYESGLLSEDETRAHLAELGFTSAQTDFFIHESLFAQVIADRHDSIPSIKKLYVQGLWSADRTAAELHTNGVPAAKADHLLHNWALEKSFADQEAALRRHKELTRAEIITAYQERIYNGDEARQHLATLGWSADEIHVLLAEADYQTTREANAAVKAATRDLFIEGRLSRQAASSRLDALNLAAAQRDALLDAWDVEATRRIPKIPLTLIEKMLAESVISHDDARAELLSQHYTERETTLLLALWGDEIARQEAVAQVAASKAAAAASRLQEAAAKAAKVAQAPARVFLTTKQAFDALGDGIITQNDVRINLLLNRLSPAAAETLLASKLGTEYKPPTQTLDAIDAEVKAAFGEGQLTLRDDPLAVQRELKRFFND